MAENPKESPENGAGCAPENHRGAQRSLDAHSMESLDLESNPDAAISRPVADGGDWLEGGCTLLDSAGRITGITEDLRIWLEQSVSALSNCDFWELLSIRCPEWSGDAVRCRNGSEIFAELKLRRPGAAGRTSVSEQAVQRRDAYGTEAVCTDVGSTHGAREAASVVHLFSVDTHVEARTHLHTHVR